MANDVSRELTGLDKLFSGAKNPEPVQVEAENIPPVDVLTIKDSGQRTNRRIYVCLGNVFHSDSSDPDKFLEKSADTEVDEDEIFVDDGLQHIDDDRRVKGAREARLLRRASTGSKRSK